VFRAAVLALRHPPPVLQRLGVVSRGDLLHSGEIGDGAGQLQDPVVGAGRKPHLGHGRAEQGLGGVVEGGVLTQVLWSHSGFERFMLNDARPILCSELGEESAVDLQVFVDDAARQ
jgi:hypothetical protein